MALCATDRIDVMDKELLADLREKKGTYIVGQLRVINQQTGYANVVLFVLRRGNDPAKFKSNHDATINSGVKG